ncbi:folate family ECF transporter S component [Petroclostridium sp. X23]|uniref:folate family ECF transporter S component n=1 Tax=Petroclostridium sp. X23 TaxID=3045146 RepID=UPI0024ADB280|nr:folate family ECF transporter S component [Petroclostridium sp. X23]WHH61064.1 folate family ECF transporter S component [Petroclostridium sp. X23]
MKTSQISNGINQTKNRFLPVFDTRTIVFMGMFIAFEILLTRFVSIETPMLRIGFGFLPVALASILFGPIVGGITAALSDVLGLIIASKASMFFPGFTANAFLRGMIFGILLYQKPKNLFRTLTAVLIITVFIDIGLTPLWLHMITGAPFQVILLQRLPANLLMIPIKIFMIQTIWRCLSVFIKHNYFKQSFS